MDRYVHMYVLHTVIHALFYSIVLPPVVSIVSEKEVQVREGERVEFVCSATGVGIDNFIYQWFLNDRPVAGQDTPTLVIVAVSENNTGDYKCFVRNQYNGIGQSEVATLVLGISLLCLLIFLNHLSIQICY